MEINKELIKHVANVSRLNLSQDEIEKFAPQFKEILESFSVLDEIDVSNTQMSIQPIKIKNSLREDNIEKCYSQKEALSQVKKNKKNGYFKGPKII